MYVFKEYSGSKIEYVLLNHEFKSNFIINTYHEYRDIQLDTNENYNDENVAKDILKAEELIKTLPYYRTERRFYYT